MSFDRVLTTSHRSGSDLISDLQSIESVGDIIGNNLRNLMRKKGNGSKFKTDIDVIVTAGYLTTECLGFFFWESSGMQFFHFVNNAHDFWITKLLELPNKRFASSSHDTSIKIWDFNTGNTTMTLKEKSEQNCVNDMAYHQRTNTLISGLYNGGISLWNLESRHKKCVLKGHEKSVTGIEWVTGNSFATCSWDSSVKIWNMRKEKCKREFKSHKKEVLSMCVSRDYSLIASGGCDRKIRIHSLKDKTLVHTFRTKSTITKLLKWKGDTKILSAHRSGVVNVWDTRKMKRYCSPIRVTDNKIAELCQVGGKEFLVGSEGGFNLALCSFEGKKSVRKKFDAHERHCSAILSIRAFEEELIEMD